MLETILNISSQFIGGVIGGFFGDLLFNYYKLHKEKLKIKINFISGYNENLKETMNNYRYIIIDINIENNSKKIYRIEKSIIKMNNGDKFPLYFYSGECYNENRDVDEIRPGSCLSSTLTDDKNYDKKKDLSKNPINNIKLNEVKEIKIYTNHYDKKRAKFIKFKKRKIKKIIEKSKKIIEEMNP